MNWSKAKDIIIISFLILNIILAVLINKERNKYILSEERCNMIYSILEKNNITYKDNFLIKKYKPMRQLNAVYEPLNLESIFCLFEYEKNNNTNIEEIFSNIINNLNIKNGKFIRDNKKYEDSNTILEYRQKYKKNIIYDNYILLKFNSTGLINIDYNYSNISTNFNKPREISSAEEIILTFIQKIRDTYPTEKIQIEKMDIVYNKININNTYNKNIVMIPFYRIYYTVSSLNKNIYSVIMINAYTNTIY